jgi:multidrug transporter EmrE-like cation transporter
MKAFASGGNFSIALPFVYVGIILLSVIVGYFFYKESLNIKQAIGILFSIVGMILLNQK